MYRLHLGEENLQVIIETISMLSRNLNHIHTSSPTPNRTSQFPTFCVIMLALSLTLSHIASPSLRDSPSEQSMRPAA